MLESVLKWFWDSADIVGSLVHICLVALIIVFLVLAIVMACKCSKARAANAALCKRVEQVEASNKELKTSVSEKDKQITKLERQLTLNSGRVADAAASVKLNKELLKVFKESLIVSRKKSSIAVDTSHILDALTVDEIKEYGEKIGAKITSGMPKDEMIKVIRKTEVMRKNLSK